MPSDVVAGRGSHREFFVEYWRPTMRCFLLTAIGSFAIMSATALCAAQMAVSTGAAGFSGIRIHLAKGGHAHDRRGKANDGHTGAATSSEQLVACGKEASDEHGKHK